MHAFSLRVFWIFHLFLLSWLAVAANLLALDPKKRITQYDIRVYQAEHGLPMNDIKDVFQDSKGYIWAATQEGLARFDGQTFVLYDKSKYPGLSENFVWDIEEDWQGNLWLATLGGGVSRFDGQRFTTYDTSDGLTSNIVRTIEVSPEHKTIWLGTHNGVTAFRGGHLVPYAHAVLKARNVYSILDNQEGQLLIVSGFEALDIIDMAKDSIYSVPLPNRDSGKSIYLIRNGEVVIGSHWGRLYGYRKGQLSSFMPSSLLGNHRILAILEDSAGNLWFGTDGNGVFRYRVSENKLDRLSLQSRLSINSDSINEIIEDGEGSLWLATGDGLVQIVDNKFVNYGIQEGMPSNFAHTVSQDLDGNMWVGFQRRGLARFDDTKVVAFGTMDGLLSDQVLAVIPAREGGIWIGTSEGLNLWKNGHKYDYQETGRHRWGVFALTENEDGRLWLGMGRGGLLTFDGQKFDEEFSLPGFEADDIICVRETADGEVWFGTRKSGLYKLTATGAKRVGARNGFSGDGVNALFEDTDGTLWIATDGQGLYRFRDQKFFQYTSTQGLAFDRLFSILEDDQSNLWFSGNRGIFRVLKLQLDSLAAGQVERLNCTGYNHLDGMRETECNGRRQPVAWKSRDGRLWFASLAGIVSVEPNNMPYNSVVPPVYIEKLETRAPAGDSESPKGRQHTVEADSAFFALKPTERDIEFHFTALSFTVPERVQFKYRLEGHDRDWVAAGTRRSASYTNLGKGLHTFSVTASNNDGVWNPTGASVRFRIPPFWWETWWAYTFYSVFLVGLFYGIRRYELNRKQLRYDLKLERKELELKQKETEKLQELDRMKSRFFANISHEFRTPLTLILGPLRRMKEGTFGKDREKQLGVMERNAKRLLQLINQLLDLSKLEAGKLELQARPADLVYFSKGVVSTFESLARQKNISLSFWHRDIEPSEGSQPSEGFLVVYFDPDKMEQILTNLLSNALKFTPEGGEISVAVGFELSESQLNEVTRGRFAEIIVKDSGIGIPADRLSHIFDRFYQAAESLTKDHPGSGIGLALTKELVELHKGQIQVTSEVGKGTEFVITLPRGKEHLKPDEIAEEEDVATDSKIEDRESKSVLDEVAAIQRPQSKDQLSSMADRTSPDDTVILIVEDNADMRDYIHDMLGSQYRVLEATDGEAGWQTAREQIPDIIITDVMMPKLDGFELCRKLKSDELTSHIPIIMLTAKGSDGSKLEGLEQGADEYLTKPFDQKELNLRIRNLLKHQTRLQAKFQKQIGFIGVSPAEVDLPSQDRQFFERAKEVVQAHMQDSDFSAEQFAKEMALSKVHLNRKLKALTGQSTSEFIRTLRLEQAAQLLKQDAQSVTEIAYTVGFNNLSYFARSFKGRFGVTPSSYRKKFRSA